MPKNEVGKINALREVLDDMELLPYLKGAERNQLTASVIEQLNTLRDSPAKEAAEYMCLYLSTHEERELIQAKELVVSLLSVYD